MFEQAIPSPSNETYATPSATEERDVHTRPVRLSVEVNLKKPKTYDFIGRSLTNSPETRVKPPSKDFHRAFAGMVDPVCRFFFSFQTTFMALNGLACMFVLLNAYIVGFFFFLLAPYFRLGCDPELGRIHACCGRSDVVG